MNKKALIVVICVVALLATTVFGTLAYLTDTDEAVNTFTVGNIDITVDETDTDENGVPETDTNGEPVDRVTENQYHLIPGTVYVKDPTMTIKAGSEEAYVRMILTVKNASAVQAIIDNHADAGVEDYSEFIDWDSDSWLYEGFEVDEEADTISFEFRYYTTVDASESEEDLVLAPLFTHLIVPGYITGEELAALYEDGFEMHIEGHAIQVAGMGDEDVAWTHFDKQMAGVVGG